MAELVDALASGASVRMDVEVRVLFWAPIITLSMTIVIHSSKKAARQFVDAAFLCFAVNLIINR